MTGELLANLPFAAVDAAALLVEGVVGAGLAATGVWALYQPIPHLQRRSLRFSSDLDSSQVQSFLQAVATLPRGHVVALDVTTTNLQPSLAFDLLATAQTFRRLQGQLAGSVPALQIALDADNEAADEPATTATNRVQLRWAGSWPLLREQPETVSAALLGTLSQLLQEPATASVSTRSSSKTSPQKVTLRLWLRPAPRMKPPAKQTTNIPTTLEGFARNGTQRSALPAHEHTAVVKKLSGPLLQVCSELHFTGIHPKVARRMTGQLVSAMQSARGQRGTLIANKAGKGIYERIGLRPQLPKAAVLSPTETAGLTAWPQSGISLPGLSYGTTTRLLPPPELPALTTHPDGNLPQPTSYNGRLFGASTWPGQQQRLIIQPAEGMPSHSVILGPSGSGKSWLVARLFLDDAAQNRPAALVDMKGDLASDIISRIPKTRRKDLVLIQPALDLPLPGLRTFAGDPELACDLLLSIFQGLYPDSFGVYSQRYLRMGFRTLAQTDRQATLADLPRLFHQPSYQQRCLKRLTDPLLKAEWNTFQSHSLQQQTANLASPLGKVSEVLARRSVRTLLAQTSPKMTITQAIAQNKLVLVALPPGRIGMPAAQLIGALVIFETYQAIMSRQQLPQHQRHLMNLYIDEPAVLGSLPLPLDSVFETARGMGCGLTLSAQTLRQLPQKVSEAALTNAATIATFRPADKDAKTIAAELPGVSSDQLMALDPHVLAAKIGIRSGAGSSVTTIQTLPLGQPTNDLQTLQTEAAERYGQSSELVDQTIAQRYESGGAAAGDDPGGVVFGEESVL